MKNLSYSFDPTQIGDHGKNQMRFELGDTVFTDNMQFIAISDEEYEAVLEAYSGKWKRAKLALVESIMCRLSYEVDEKVGPLSLSLRQRYENWKAMYDKLKKEIASITVPSANPSAINGGHYFYEGIHNNPNAGGTEKDGGRRVP